MNKFCTLFRISGTRNWFCYFLLLLYFPFISQAQVKSIGLPKIINYNKTDYNGGAQNWDIAQDKKGNLYFANTAGLLQFNGSSWDKKTVPNNTIRALKISESGIIYVGGYNEFGFFKADAKGKLVYHSLISLAGAKSGKLIGFIWKVHILKDAIFFQGFDQTYIYKDNKITVLDAPHRFQFSYMVNGKLYFQDLKEGLLEYRGGKLLALPGTKVFNTTEIWGILSMPDNKLLIVTLDKGVFLYDNNTAVPWATEANAFMLKNNCLGGRAMNNSTIVLNSVLDGIIICTMQGKIVQHINNKKGLLNNTALSSFIDNTNNLWLGLDNGISFVNENSPFTFLGTGHDLGAVYASAVLNNKLYVATNQGVFIHDWITPFREESFKFIEGTTGQAWNIQKIDNKLYCSHNRGLFIVEDGKAGRFLDNKQGYFCLKPLPGHPNYLIAANYAGFAVFEKKDGSWVFRNQIRGFKISDNKFAVDGQNIWQKVDNNMYCLRLSGDLTRFEKIRIFKTLNESVKGITSVQQLKGKTYFQTNNRFYTYSPSTDKFIEDKALTKEFKELPAIRYCSEDSMGNICYFYGESSMGMLLKNGGGYQHIYSPFSSLTGNLVYFFESVNAIDKQNFLIGLSEGLVHYNPQLQNVSYPKPKAYVRSFLFAGDTLITGNMPAVRKMDLPYASNNIKFTFSSPVYDNPANIKFSYKLEGFDDKWSNWAAASVKEYTNLREGDYRMQVKVIDSFGIQSNPSVVSFAILPPFYRHPIAYVVYILLFGLIIAYIRNSIKVKIRKNKYYETVEQRRLYLEKEAKIRQEQYELEKEIERLRNEQLKVKILTKDKELVSNSLQVAKKNRLLNGIITKLKDIDSEIVDEGAKVRLTKLHKSVTKELNTDKSWNNIEKHIRNVHFDFLKRLKELHPTITPREMDLATYLLMNMSTKEISEIMNISDGGVELARYRLRKKLNLSRKESLTGFLMSI